MRRNAAKESEQNAGKCTRMRNGARRRNASADSDGNSNSDGGGCAIAAKLQSTLAAEFAVDVFVDCLCPNRQRQLGLSVALQSFVESVAFCGFRSLTSRSCARAPKALTYSSCVCVCVCVMFAVIIIVICELYKLCAISK